jgi:Leucine-rich repeat (LRR) protein/membrane-associated phospholipid phosphatase
VKRKHRLGGFKLSSRKRTDCSNRIVAGRWTDPRLWLVLLVAGGGPAFGADSPSLASTRQNGLTLSIETKDGMLTATFQEQTDDEALRSAVPAMVANNVQAINLRGTPLVDISPLVKMTGLKALDISGTQVQDLRPLAALIHIASLNLQFLRIQDLRPLSGLAELRTLNIGGTEVRDLSPLADLTELRELGAAVTKVSDLTPIARLRELTSLNLGSTWVADIGPLAGMTNLRFLNLNGTPVDDVQPLAHLTALQTLDLGGTRVSSVRPLAGLRALRSLNLEGTLVADVTPLAGLTALRSVALGGSRVRDTTPLAHLAVAPADQPNQPDADPVLVWNDLANRAVQATRTDAFEASRALAMESIAVLDTIQSIDGTPGFLVRLPPPRDISVNLAVAAAAHAMLGHLFPSRRAFLDAALAAAVEKEPAGSGIARAIAFGAAVADAVAMLRNEDVSMATASFGVAGTARGGVAGTARGGDTGTARGGDIGKAQGGDTGTTGADVAGTAGPDDAGTPPGEWRPTPPAFQPAAHPQWATMHPVALTRPDQFRPSGPPPLDSEAFRQARAVVASLGGARSTSRTEEQTDIARYWSDAIGTYAPAGHWNSIAANIIAPLRLGTAVEAELFAELNVAMADAGIAMADAKYTYRFWRPITAIRAGDAATPPDPAWTPLLDTPNHPSYVSGHSAFSGAAASVLTTWFGSRAFTFSSASLPGLTRHFANFQQAAEEAALSRVYGGIHFPFDNVDGLATGRSVGAWTMTVFEHIAQDRGPTIMVMDRVMDRPPAGKIYPQEVVGCAVDNVSPVAAVTVRLDGGPPFNVVVDDRGLFVVPTARLSPARHHAIVVTAISITGRSTTTEAQVD